MYNSLKMKWPDVLARDPIFLNLGGQGNCHPAPGYLNYISVDLKPGQQEWYVQHDLRQPIPLPDGSVARILSEELVEHLEVDEIRRLLGECYRLLKTRGVLRLGMPDYNNPKDIRFLAEGKDPRYPEHKTFPHYELMRDLAAGSPFKRWLFYQYWENGEYIHHDIDYSLGMIKRTPENTSQNWRINLKRRLVLAQKALDYWRKQGLWPQWDHPVIRPGHPQYVTSLVVDLYKD